MAMSRTYRFAGFELDEALRELRRDGRAIPLQPKPLALLLYLLHHRHRVVSRAELLEALWPGVVVQDDALGFALHAARRAVGDDGREQRVIRTVPRQGFRLVAAVEQDGQEAPATAPGAPAEPFVGRADVLAAFAVAIDEACAGQGALLLLSGEPGIGKTRTGEVVAELARARGLRALAARCSEGDGAPAFWPWIQVLRPLLRGLGGAALARHLGPGAPEVARLIPELDDPMRERRSAPAGDPRAARFLLFEGISSALREAAREQPLLVVIDDLHRADQSSLLLLRHLAHDLHDTRLLLLAAYREAEWLQDPARAALSSELLRQGRTRALSLAGLSPSEVGEFVLATTGQFAARAVREGMHEQTNGNPFFLHQIVRILRQEQRTAALGEGRPLRFELPRRVQDAVVHQLGGLPADTLELLELAAVFGRDFRLGPLLQASGRGREELLACLAGALEARVITEDRHPGDYRFAHVLVRDALYQRLEPVRRARLHERAGVALEHWQGEGGADPLELAHHFSEAARAGEAGKGIDAAIRAGEWALGRLAYDEAVTSFERALALIDRFAPDDRRRRCEVQLALGDAQTRSGARDAARRTFAAVARVAKAMSLPHELAQAALRFAPDFLAIESGVYDDDLVALLEEALQELDPADDPVRARLLARLAVALHWAPSPDPRLPAFSEEAVRMAERLGDLATLRYARCARELAQYSVAEPERYLRDPSDLPLAPGDEPVALLEKMLRMTSLLWLGRVAEFDHEIEAFARLAERLRQPQSRWYVGLFRAVRAAMDGRFEDARRAMRAYQREGERAQDENVLHSLRLLTFMISIDRGGVEPLGPAVAQMAERFPAMIGWRGGLTLYYAEVGRHDDARREIESLLREDLEGMRRRNDWSAIVTALAVASATVGHEEGARRAHRLLEPYAESIIVIGYASYGWAAASLALGVTAAACREWDRAEAHFADAFDRHRRIGARPALAQTHFWSARMLLARGAPGDARRARAELAAGRRLAEELGMARLAGKFELLAGWLASDGGG